LDYLCEPLRNLGVLCGREGDPTSNPGGSWTGHNPANGWSLYGLLASLRAQGKIEEANAVQKRFRDAWRLADVTLTASRF
jgi:hypothetical protein